MSLHRVFISSREQELEPEREMAEMTVEAMGIPAIRFEIDLVPQPTAPRTAYLDGVDSADLFVLILWQQSSPAIVQEYTRAQRRGKHILCLQKNLRTDYGESVSPELRKLMDDIARDGHSSARFRTLKELQEKLRQGIVLALGRMDAGRFHATKKEDLFVAGTELIEAASERVVLMAKTPIPLVGTRPYDDSRSPIGYERQQFEAFDRLIEEAVGGTGRHFRCVATKPNMKKEIADGGPPLRNRAKDRLGLCHAKSQAPGSRFQLLWVEQHLPSAMSFLVADDSFLIWLSDGSGESVWMQARNERMAMALDTISKLDSKPTPLEDLTRFLEL